MTAPLIAPTPSKLQRVYFRFGKALHPSDFKSKLLEIFFFFLIGWFVLTDFSTEEESIRAFRDAAKVQLEQGIKALQNEQSQDPQRLTINRMTQNFKSIFPSSSSGKKSPTNGQRDSNKQHTQ